MIKLNKVPVGDGFRPFIVAEISANHTGSLKNALLLIKYAKECGVDAVKFQTFTAETMTLNFNRRGYVIKDKNNLWKEKKLFNLYKKNETPSNWHKKLFLEAKKNNVLAFSSPFSTEAVDFLETFNVPCYKVASFEINHFPLLKRIAQTKKPVILSTGMASFPEIKEAYNFLKKNGTKKIIILKCTSSYPADEKDMNLITIKDLKKKFKCPVGLSDHNIGIGPAIGSIFFGANLIEKHFTLKKNNRADGKFSLDKKELFQFVKEAHAAWLSIGKIFYGSSKKEKGSLSRRRTIFAIKKIKKGEKFSPINIGILRPSLGLHPRYYFKIIGKKSLKNINYGSPLKKNMINNLI